MAGVFEVKIPTHPAPVECKVDGFGLTYGGQAASITRLLGGIDLAALAYLKQNYLVKPATRRHVELQISGSRARHSRGRRIIRSFAGCHSSFDNRIRAHRSVIDAVASKLLSRTITTGRAV